MDLSQPRVMAVINVTPDSFSDGGRLYREGRVDLDTVLREVECAIDDGAALIDNPVSAAPGFTLGNVHVMAGVPAIFQAMVASVLPTLTGGAPL